MIKDDYAERVYAGVLGKMTGVYLGRPFEGWTYEQITAELGEIHYYVNDHPTAKLRHRRLVVTDDDLAGTFAFARSLADNGFSPALNSRQIGESWLNYIVEGHSILWWGGIGTSTEQTVYARLRDGIPAPLSGAIETNGKTLAEQIGAQIFIDGWAMMNPGNPERAAYFAREAARVSHDGIAVEAAVLIAAMEALAFDVQDIDKLLDGGLAFVSKDSELHALIGTIRDWHAGDSDWRRTRERIAASYGYDKFPGICHVVPNHALVVMSLLHGRLDLSTSLEIVCTSGWDTDCNAGNVGCLVGIARGLAAFETAPDWRRPVRDRLYVSTAEGGRTITDAVIETHQLVQAGHALAGLPVPDMPKNARFNFSLPGSLQGFAADLAEDEGDARICLENVAGHGSDGQRSLAVRFEAVGSKGARVMTRTFAMPDEFDMRSYDLLCSPTLYPGQTVEMRVVADAANGASVMVSPCCQVFTDGDRIETVAGQAALLPPGQDGTLRWTVPQTDGQPILSIGLALCSCGDEPSAGSLYLDFLRWSGAPVMVLRRPAGTGEMWRRAWVADADTFGGHFEAFRISHHRGTGMAIQGTREWHDYSVRAEMVPLVARRWGLAARVQGRRRYYAVIFDADQEKAGMGGRRIRLVRVHGAEQTLCQVDFLWRLDCTYRVELKVDGSCIEASVDGRRMLTAIDTAPEALGGGAIALLVEEGGLAVDEISLSAANPDNGSTI
ncbi:MAG: ADP-ribosylglycohydrolase family protein [Rhizobiales bacterium]|nr:ADP-ribosylglycohydrolase family protein [Hyphomicrobiales bacterium]